MSVVSHKERLKHFELLYMVNREYGVFGRHQNRPLFLMFDHLTGQIMEVFYSGAYFITEYPKMRGPLQAKAHIKTYPLWEHKNRLKSIRRSKK